MKNLEFIKYSFNLYFFYLKRWSAYIMLFKGHFIHFFPAKCLLMSFTNFSVGLLIIFLSIFNVSEIIHCFVCDMSWKYFPQLICFFFYLWYFFVIQNLLLLNVIEFSNFLIHSNFLIIEWPFPTPRKSFIFSCIFKIFYYR